MIINKTSQVKINNEILTTLVDDELGMMNIDKGFYYTLNTVGKFIWELIENDIAVNSIYNKLLEEYDVNEEECYNELIELLKVLEANGLIEIENV